MTTSSYSFVGSPIAPLIEILQTIKNDAEIFGLLERKQLLVPNPFDVDVSAGVVYTIQVQILVR